MQAVPFPVEPVFGMRPGLQLLDMPVAQAVAPETALAFAQAQDAVEAAVRRQRLPLVMSFGEQAQASGQCEALIATAHKMLTGSSGSGALSLRRSLQDDFVLMVADDASPQSTGLLRAAVMAVAAPTGWDPARVVGQDFSAIHQPVADAALIQRAAVPLSRLLVQPGLRQRQVWTLSASPALSLHPADGIPRTAGSLDAVWFRSERQTIVPIPGAAAAIFLIRVFVTPLAQILAVDPSRASLLCQALRSMSDAVVQYKGLAQIRRTVLAELETGDARSGAG